METNICLGLINLKKMTELLKCFFITYSVAGSNFSKKSRLRSPLSSIQLKTRSQDPDPWNV